MTDMTDMTDRHDVVIVGAGIAGLVAAATAAEAGADVVVLDGRAPGGRARTSHLDGFSFNDGPHAVYERGALMAAVTRFGVAAPGGPPALSGAAGWKRGARSPLPLRTRDALTTKILSARSKIAARRVFARLDDVAPADVAHVSLAQFLADQRAPEDLRLFVMALARLTTYANAPELLSTEAYVNQYRAGKAGVRYLDGGWQSLVDGLAGAAGRAGAKILDHRAATGLEPDGADWVVHTSRGDLAAGAVVLAVGLPAEAARLAGADLGWVEAAGPPVRAACLDLGLTSGGDVPFLLGIDEPYYLSTHAPPARLAPDGHVVIQVARYLAAGERPDRATAEAGLWQHAAHAGIARSSVVAHRYLHEMTVAGGLPLASRGGFAGRPAVVVAERPGLFLAGDWVGPVGMIGDAAAASGAAAGRAAGVRIAERAA